LFIFSLYLSSVRFSPSSSHSRRGVASNYFQFVCQTKVLRWMGPITLEENPIPILAFIGKAKPESQKELREWRETCQLRHAFAWKFYDEKFFLQQRKLCGCEFLINKLIWTRRKTLVIESIVRIYSDQSAIPKVHEQFLEHRAHIISNLSHGNARWCSEPIWKY
jgi:hypothetical protein